MGVVDNLLDGFLVDRDEDTFVYADEENRLGWEKKLGKEDSYSTFMLGRDKVDESKKHEIAHRMAKNAVAVMDLPFKVNVAFTPKDNFFDGKTVHVGTAVLDDKDLTFNEQIDVIKGLAIHEAAHADSTEMGEFKKFIEKNKKDSIVKSLFNIIEDERIERIVGSKTPGYSRFLGKTKEYFFEKKFLDKVPDESKMTDADKVIGEIFKLIRYPKYLDEEKIEDFEDELFEVKDILTGFEEGYPMTQAEAEKSTEAVYKVVEKYCEKKAEEEEAAGGAKSSGTPSMSSEMSSALEEVAHGADEALSGSETSEFTKRHEEEVRVIEESMEFDAESRTTFEYAPVNKDRYESIRKEVTAYASTISRLLRWEAKNKIDNLIRLKSGSLDTNFLVEARQRVDNVYYRTRRVKSEKVCVCLLIDESGSMSGTPISSARKTGVLFAEALHKVPHVDLYVYGHTADATQVFKSKSTPSSAWGTKNYTNIIIYKEPGKDNFRSIASAEARGNNRDGVAITEVAKRVRSFTQDKVLYLVLSDGQPSASGYGGSTGMAHTKQAVQRCEKMGMHIIQVAMNNSVDSKKMFKNYVKFTDMSSLAKDMGKLMKKLVTSLSSTVVD